MSGPNFSVSKKKDFKTSKEKVIKERNWAFFYFVVRRVEFLVFGVLFLFSTCERQQICGIFYLVFTSVIDYNSLIIDNNSLSEKSRIT